MVSRSCNWAKFHSVELGFLFYSLKIVHRIFSTKSQNDLETLDGVSQEPLYRR